MIRIVGGRWRGRHLVTPRGAATRPTAEKVRAAVANALAAAGGLDGASVLDLYAGSGALGLELASWGAARVVLVEQDRAAQAAIRANIEQLGATGVRLVPGSVAGFVAGLVSGAMSDTVGDTAGDTAAGTVGGTATAPGEVFDVVVADPPYAEPPGTLRRLLGDLQAAGRLRSSADLVVELAARTGEFDWPDPLVAVKARRYGDTLVCYGRAP